MTLYEIETELQRREPICNRDVLFSGLTWFVVGVFVGVWLAVSLIQGGVR